MSDIKCPFCQQELIPCIKNQNDWIYHCDNQKCPMYDDADNENAKHPLASKDLWQELIRTRKALKIAKDTFNWIDETYRTGQEMEAEIWGKVQLAAQEITALEQKDK